MNSKNLLLFLFLLLFTKVSTARQLVDKMAGIPIIGWSGIPESETNIQRYQQMKDGGFTHSVTFFKSLKNLIKALKVADEVGMKIIASCPEIKSKTELTIKQLMNYPALGGYYIIDEPNISDFKKLKTIVQTIRSIDDQHICYINLFPNYAGEYFLGTKSYNEYVSEFVKEIPVQVLSFDNYPIQTQGFRPDFYDNLEYISRVAKESGKPFWAFTLSVAHADYPIPTIGELRLQNFSNLAYGAKALQYFTYWTPSGSSWDYNNAPVTEGGQLTDVYDRVKQLNKEVKAVSAVFKNSKVISVYHTGSTVPKGTKRLIKLPSPITVLETTGEAGALVSLLQNGKKMFLVIVNKDYQNKVKLIFHASPKVLKISKDGSMAPAMNYTSLSEMEPGDMAIYTWEE
jgi:hypothetical protein